MAWPTDRRPSDALTGELVPELWSARVIDHVMSNLVCANVVDTSWRTQLSRGDVLHIPVMTTLTSYVVDTTVTAAIGDMNTTATTTAESLTIDKWRHVPIQIDDSVKTQTQVGDLLDTTLQSASYELEKQIDTDVNGQFSSLTAMTGNIDGQTFTDDMLIQMLEQLDEADVSREGRNLVGDPSLAADCYKIDKFMNLDYSNNPLGKQNGYRGTIAAYNIPLWVTNNLTAGTTGSVGALLQPEAIGLVIQDPISISKARVESAASDVVYVRVMWGSDVLRSTHGIYFYTRKQ